MKCDNCSNDATYLIAPAEASSVKYCVRCLPAYLKPQADRGDFAIKAAPAPSKSSKSSAPEAPDTPTE